MIGRARREITSRVRILRFGNAENRARELAIGADFLETLPAEPQQIPCLDPRREWMMALVY